MTKWEAGCLTDKIAEKAHETIDKADKEELVSIVTALKAILELLKK